MKVSLSWVEKMQFRATAGNHTVSVDAKRPIGDDQGILPKELLLAAMASCTAMDVAALLRKHKQVLKEFTVAVDATPSEGKHPKDTPGNGQVSLVVYASNGFQSNTVCFAVTAPW